MSEITFCGLYGIVSASPFFCVCWFLSSQGNGLITISATDNCVVAMDLVKSHFP